MRKLFILLGVIWSVIGFAQEKVQYYEQMIRGAHRLVVSRKTQRLPATEQAGKILDDLNIKNHPFKLGDSWELSALRIQKTEVAPSGRKNEVFHSTAYFHCQVLSVKEGNTLIEIKPKDLKSGEESMQVLIDSFYRVKSKTVFTSDGAVLTQEMDPLKADPGLSGIPFYLPNLGLVKGNKVGEGYRFETEDLLGRPISVLWRKNERWPSTVQTPSQLIQLIMADS